MILQMAKAEMCGGFNTSIKERLKHIEDAGYNTELFVLASHTETSNRTFENVYRLSLVHGVSMHRDIMFNISFMYAFFLSKDFMHPNPDLVKTGDVVVYLYPNTLEPKIYGEPEELVLKPSGKKLNNYVYKPKVTVEGFAHGFGNDLTSTREVGTRTWEPFVFLEDEVEIVDDGMVIVKDGLAISKRYFLNRLSLIPFI